MTILHLMVARDRAMLFRNVSLLILLFISSFPLHGNGSDIRVFETDSVTKFLNVNLSGNADALGQQQFKSWFSNADGSTESGCIRGEAERLLQEGPTLQSNFFKKANSFQAIESGILKSGEEIVIASTGCEYYVLAIRYSFSEKPLSISNDLFWMNKAALALRKIDQLKRAASVFNFLRIAKVFEEGAKKKNTLANIMGPTGDCAYFLETKVEINRIGYLPNKKGSFIEIVLSKGPL